MIHGINSGLIMQAVKKVREEPSISKERFAYDCARRKLADNKTIQEYITALTHSNIGLM